MTGSNGDNPSTAESRDDAPQGTPLAEPPITRRSAIGKAQRAVVVAAPLILLLRPGKAYAASHHSS